MHLRWISVLTFVLVMIMIAPASADTVTLINGTFLEGEIVDITEDGLVVRQRGGDYSERIHWSDFGLETLKELYEKPEARDWVEPYMPVPPEVRRKMQEITITEVQRPSMPTGTKGTIESLMTPMGFLIIGVLFFANLYVAYEIAAFRNQATALVCAVSAVLPVLGPVIFLALPSRQRYHEQFDSGEEDDFENAPAAPAPPPKPGGIGVAGGGGLSLAAQAGGSAAGEPGVSKAYDRNHYEFIRSFIEKEFAGFFRMVPKPADKDLVIAFRTPKQEYVGKRISRISSNELQIILQRGGAEARIVLNEIESIVVRHKDAKS